MKTDTHAVTHSFEKYGRFNESGREFVIHRPDTPKPWLNYIWNSQVLSIVDQRGRGSCVYRSEDGERTNLINDRIVYVLDRESNDCWTVGWDPAHHKYDRFECHYGLGYSRIETLTDGIYSSLTITCAKDAPVEMWKIVLRNKSERVRKITLCPYTEFDLGGVEVYGGIENSTFAQIDADRSSVFAINGCMSRSGYKNNCFLCADHMPAAIETSKRNFVGGIYETVAKPLSLIAGMSGFSNTSNEPLIAALSYPLDLASGEEVAIYIVIGPFDQPNEIPDLSDSYLGEDAFQTAIEAWEKHVTVYENVNISCLLCKDVSRRDRYHR